MLTISRHIVTEGRVLQALGGIHCKTLDFRDRILQGEPLTASALTALRDELLDYVGAESLEDPELVGSYTQMVLRTAAECALGALGVAVFPWYDFEVPLPLIGIGVRTGDAKTWRHRTDPVTPAIWLAAFRTWLSSGEAADPSRAVAMELKCCFAPAIRAAASNRAATQGDWLAEVAEMDALCRYLPDPEDHPPAEWPNARLRKPTALALSEAARSLDTLTAQSPSRRLLRTLLEDDQPLFEQALAATLTAHHDRVVPDRPRTLLPVDIIAPVVIAVRVHGWDLRVRSDYLPRRLTSAT
ncbi:hypothetical protein NN3_18300 [Nocardia neocaledoniensis NBRC 108232]|uniref:Immunity protein 49 of polymorphic toxin system n=1 Tax=Nocardia neocaledoniensis TaxID=236511 RepID=A0A317N6U6_9NOCA|nr:immunity 49 family protein [Nocardia neocaledoniensis]PWV70447.1 immunity protein 49 of polymorphic toxin system [Nocardia neocaledoniensis]GEM30823.1 hypothetical protein NN3_18300 [Nocardia neocaledoniensis NBRC 108232]